MLIWLQLGILYCTLVMKAICEKNTSQEIISRWSNSWMMPTIVALIIDWYIWGIYILLLNPTLTRLIIPIRVWPCEPHDSNWPGFSYDNMAPCFKVSVNLRIVKHFIAWWRNFANTKVMVYFKRRWLHIAACLNWLIMFLELSTQLTNLLASFRKHLTIERQLY